MAFPLFQLSSSLLKASIKPPLLCFTIPTPTLSPHFLNPNVKFLPLLKTSLRCSVAEAEAAPKELEDEQMPKTRLCAQNIPWDSKADEIRALFEKHGTVIDIEVSMYNKLKNRGLAFISMSSEEEAQTAIKNLDKTEFGGRKINVDFARSQKKKPSVPQVGPKFKYSVFVGNLPFTAKSQDLREFFQKDGSVVSAQIIYNSRPRRSTGYGFVSYYTKEEADVAIKTFEGKEFMGRPLKMGYAKEITTEAKTDGDSTESKTEISQENTENVKTDGDSTESKTEISQENTENVKTDGDSTESKTEISQENTENVTSVTEEKTANV